MRVDLGGRGLCRAKIEWLLKEAERLRPSFTRSTALGKIGGAECYNERVEVVVVEEEEVVVAVAAVAAVAQLAFAMSRAERSLSGLAS